MKKLMMEPGSALLVMAVLAFVARWAIGGVGIPLIGGLLTFTLFWLAIFGVVGGVFLLIKMRAPSA